MFDEANNLGKRKNCGVTASYNKTHLKTWNKEPIILAVGTFITDQSLDEDLFRLVCPSVRLTKLKYSLFLNMMEKHLGN